MKKTVDLIALRMWRKDVLSVLLFQWMVLACLVLLTWLLFSQVFAINVLFSGLSVALPALFLAFWLGVKLLLGHSNSNAVFIALFLKTLLSSACLLGSLFILKNSSFGLIWQGFFVGLVGMVLAPMLYGIWCGFIK